MRAAHKNLAGGINIGARYITGGDNITGGDKDPGGGGGGGCDCDTQPQSGRFSLLALAGLLVAGLRRRR